MSVRARAAMVTLLGALLLASLAAGPTAAAAPTAEAGGNVTFALQLQEDGDARWTVRATYTLETESQRSAFAELSDAYERGEAPSLGIDTFRNASEAASAVTGRSMAIRDVRRGAAPESTIENGTGWLSLSFTWTNFARSGEDGQLLVDDAFNTSEGTWLSRLGPNESLVIVPPSGHNPFTGDCDLTERSFRCTGPMTFDSGSPAWVFTGDASSEGLLTPALVVAGLLGLLVVVFVVARRRDGLPRPGDIDDVVGGEADETAEAPAAAGAAGEDDADSAPAVDLELLSDEERVEHLLEQNGGRMKQASIVKETGWSNAKVSQLLSSMEDEDRIDKLRIGRENLISFPDEDVADIDE